MSLSQTEQLVALDLAKLERIKAVPAGYANERLCRMLLERVRPSTVRGAIRLGIGSGGRRG